MLILVEENVFQERTALHSSNGAVYALQRNLKKAIYGCVYLGVELECISTVPLIYSWTQRKVAVKIIDKAKVEARRSQEDPLKEMSVAQYLADSPHPHLMGQLESISDNTHYYIVMEFSGGGELFDMLDREKHFSERLTRHYFTQIVAGLEHLHSMGVCHRDMSLENMLVSEDSLSCQIIDFGMSLRFACDNEGNPLPFSPLGACGKKYYMSPEVLADDEDFVGPLVDVWALGVMLFILLVGAPPVRFASPLCERFCRVAAGDLRGMVAGWGVTYVSDQAFDLLERILRVNPAERLSLAEIRAHPWMMHPQ